ncbi:uncharacterized protein LOC104443069 [Eucalyptus grandis]|uniref:uncharacterized protein LOC104443069 n=1 Tax=Eucalyptus grandis TaxID=71139 RepID=UPI00192E87E0|nr:uncharacterized protein LOC104443069 [Eucalyptus grandis]
MNRGRLSSKRPTGRSNSRNPQQKSWVAVAQTVAKGYDSVYTPPTLVNNKPVIEITDQDLKAVDPKMHQCLMGHFIGHRLPFRVVEEALKKLWGPNLFEVMSNSKGLFMFHISNRDFRRNVLKGGRVTVANVPLILQQWTPGLELRKENHPTVPVWIRLSNLPFSCWSAQFIGKVASAVGKPVYVDQRTEQLKSLSFARVCVEIAANQTFDEVIETTYNGEKCEIGVEFEWKPSACAICEGSSQQINEDPRSLVVAAYDPSVEGSSCVWFSISKGLSGLKGPWGNAGLSHEAESLQADPDSMLPLVSDPGEVGWKQEDEICDFSPREDATADKSVKAPSALAKGSIQEQLLQIRHDPPDLLQPETSKATKSSRKAYKRRGIMDTVRRAEVRKLVAVNKLSLIGLFETKVPEQLFDSISSSILRGWRWIANYDYAPRGRIWIGRNPYYVDFDVISLNDQAIHGRLNMSSSNFTCCVSAINGEHTFVHQRPLWDDLIFCDELFQDYAWLVSGDFNAIKDPSDRFGGSNAWIPYFDEFKLCLDQTELEDLKYSGLRFTWSTSAGEARKMRKIDRVLVNSKWRMDFSYSEASFLNPGISYHTPMVVRVVDPQPRRKPFKFFDFWADHPDFRSTISHAWNSQRTLQARENLRSTEMLLQSDPEDISLAELERVFLSFFMDLLAPRVNVAKPDLQELTSLIPRPLTEGQVLEHLMSDSDVPARATVAFLYSYTGESCKQMVRRILGFLFHLSQLAMIALCGINMLQLHGRPWRFMVEGGGWVVLHVLPCALPLDFPGVLGGYVAKVVGWAVFV